MNTMNTMVNKTLAVLAAAGILTMGAGGAGYALAKSSSSKALPQDPSCVMDGLSSVSSDVAYASGLSSEADLLQYMSASAATPSTQDPFKEETVYVIAGQDGTVNKVIVSDWIRNTAGKNDVQDVSELSDVQVLKDGETFTMGGENTRVWNASTDDIYYQGNIEKELPVDVKVSYFLDGSPIAPSELPGKSGRVTIRFDYTNNTYEMKEINGKSEKIYVPFTMLTGLLLDNSAFANVEVSNGKIINDGSRTAVIGFAFPGLSEDLGISPDKLTIPDYVEISADCVNFSMGMTVTIASNEIVNQIDPEKLKSGESIDLDEAMQELTDAMEQLTDGSSKLYDGLCTLLDKSKELVTGIDQLADGAQKLADGAASLDEGAGKLADGSKQLYDGLSELDAHSSELNDGARQVFEGLLETAYEQLNDAGLSVPQLTIGNYAEVLNGVINSLDDSAVYQQALDTVTSAVEEKRDYIREQVTTAVQSEVETKVEEGVRESVTEKVIPAVREQVQAAVEENVRAAVAEQVIQTAAGMDKASYDQAVAAGLVDAATQQMIEGAIDQQMATDDVQALIEQNTEAQMESAEIQGKISAAVDQQMATADVQSIISSKVDETMAGADIVALIDQNTDAQVEKTISETMAGDEVQTKLEAASEGAKKVIDLKASLDGYNTFYIGLSDYTSAVGQVLTGAGSLKDGASQLKDGTAQLSSGANTLYDGILQMKDGAPALIDGITQLRDGAMQLSSGLEEFDEKGVQKIVDLVDGDLAGLAARLQATMEVSKNYINYSGIADGMDGQVKFIYKTEEIE